MNYQISAINTSKHSINVTLCFTNENKKNNKVYLPNWTPGSYMIRDFCRHIVSIKASCNDIPQVLYQINKNTWEMENLVGEWKIEYEIYAFDLSVRGAFLDSNRLFFDGAAVLMCVAGLEDEHHQISFRLPENWTIATGLDSIGDFSFNADNYFTLIDSPITASSSMRSIDFMAGEIPHRIIITGEYEYLDENRLSQDVQSICQKHIERFSHAPFKSYLFHLHVGENIYGGLEHLSSSALLSSRKCLPSTRHKNNRDDYIQLLGLFSHEYFHAWNVKTIRPNEFARYNLQTEVYTNQLWAFEGITSYYDDLTLVQSKVITSDEYLKLILKTIDTVQNQHGQHIQSVAQSSFNAWTKYYKQNENSPNTIVSYYQKGSLIALCLDAIIRQNSQYSLDDLMQIMYQQALNGKTISDEDWQKTAETLTNCDLSHFFQQAIYGTTKLPLEECLSYFGVKLNFQAALKYDLVKDFPSAVKKINLGIKFKDDADGKKITHIAYNSIGEMAGLSVNDKIIAINHCGISEFEDISGILKAHDIVCFHYFRNNRLYETSIKCPENYQMHYLMKIEDKEKLNSWLQ